MEYCSFDSHEPSVVSVCGYVTMTEDLKRIRTETTVGLVSKEDQIGTIMVVKKKGM